MLATSYMLRRCDVQLCFSVRVGVYSRHPRLRGAFETLWW